MKYMVYENEVNNNERVVLFSDDIDFMQMNGGGAMLSHGFAEIKGKNVKARLGAGMTPPNAPMLKRDLRLINSLLKEQWPEHLKNV